MASIEQQSAEATGAPVAPPSELNLEETFAGTLLRDGDAGYDETRKVFNGMVDRRPAVIARCTGVADVVAAVNHAREQGLPLSVRAGGHGVTGAAVNDGGVVIDLREMKGVHVDPRTRTCHVQGGADWGHLDRETQQFGLAVTGGRVPGTGVAGLALGSGSGWIERKFGLTCDSLISAEVVTADGRVVVASETENAELFWGLRGGGGNFGIVTSFEFRLHEVGPILFGGMLMYPHVMAREVLRHWADFMETAPDEVNAAAALISAPPEEFVPEPVRGKPVLGLIVSYTGPVQDAEAHLRPLLDFGPPAVAMVGPMPYVALQGLIAGGAIEGMRNYWTADFLSGLPDPAIEILVEATARPPHPLAQTIIVPGGGAIARVPEDAMAFGQRKAPFNLHILTMWDSPDIDDAGIAYTRGLGQAMKPYSTGRAYLNFIGDEGSGRVQAAFGPETYARLVALKDEWDPGNLFRMNQNIAPSNGASATG